VLTEGRSKRKPAALSMLRKPTGWRPRLRFWPLHPSPTPNTPEAARVKCCVLRMGGLPLRLGSPLLLLPKRTVPVGAALFFASGAELPPNG
jgi:hypothetical protein